MNYREGLKKATWLFVGMILFFTFFSRTINNMNTPRVKTVEPENGYLIKTLRGKGKIVPENSVRLYLPIQCIIDKVLVNPGESVEEGTALLVLNSSMIHTVWEREYNKYYETQLELEQEKEALLPGNSKVFNLNELEKRFLVAVENKEAKEELYQEGCLSRKDFEEAEILLVAAESEYRAAFENEAAGRRNEAVRLRNVERRISILELELETMTKEIDVLKTLIQNPVFRSPAAGTIIKLLCNEGEIYQIDEPVMILSGGTGALFTAQLDSSLSDDIIPGTRASIFLERSSEITGTLLSVSPNPDGQTYDLVFSVEDHPTVGEPGFFIMRKRSPYYDCIIPERALRGTGSNRFLYVIDEKEGVLSDSKIIRKCSVRLLDSGDQLVAVSGDVSDTARIVYDEDRRTLSENINVIVQ